MTYRPVGPFQVMGADRSGWSWDEGKPCATLAEAVALRDAYALAYPYRVYFVSDDNDPEAGDVSGYCGDEE